MIFGTGLLSVALITVVQAVAARRQRSLDRGRGDAGPFPWLDAIIADEGEARATTFTDLDLQERTFGWPTEMMVAAAEHGARVMEVPVSWHVRNAGSSKVSGTIVGSVLAGWHILRITIRYRHRDSISS